MAEQVSRFSDFPFFMLRQANQVLTVASYQIADISISFVLLI